MGHVIKEIANKIMKVEYNADERVHIHTNGMRLDLSLAEYSALRQACLEALKKLKEKHGIK